jgi:hypothetical protein
MAAFFVVQKGFLVSHGFAPDGCEHLQAGDGQTVVLGTVPGFDGQAAPNAGAKWHVANQCWVDTRSDEERQLQAIEDLAAARRVAYPPLADLADALYWQMQGDESKMREYMARCAEVKRKNPKSKLVG